MAEQMNPKGMIMKIRTQKLAWMVAANLYIFVGSPPVWADDTELLLLNPSAITQPKPNILFILDTSGSMGSLESTVEPYDSAQTYTGTCDTSKLYWSAVSNEPVCDGTETQIIKKSSFMCASSVNQLAGIGSYSNTMVQWRPTPYTFADGSSGSAYWWQSLLAGDETSFIECQSDRSIHGDGTVGEVYATAYGSFGAGGNPWVSDPTVELSWGSAPRNVEYTVYDGNYLNWKLSPVTVNLSRMAIVREVTKTVLNSITEVNVGIMRFNNQNGGPVIQGITDLDTNRTKILNTIDTLNAGGKTPLSETLYEAALYWNGLPAEFGENITEHTTDPNALVSSGPEIYRTPIVDSCAKNYNVLLTDGVPVNDEEAHALVPTLPQFAALTGNAACVGGNDGDCLDDIGEYLKLRDSDAVQPGIQNVTTHTIGFSINLPILADTAKKSGGEYFLANDVQNLTIALLQIVNDITDKSLAFSAPAVSVNTFNRTQNLNDIYLTMFGVKNKVHWPGNLKKYEITNRVSIDMNGDTIVTPTITDANGIDAVNPATGFFNDNARSYWSVGADGNDVALGGSASRLPDPIMRKLLTFNGINSNLSSSNNMIIPSNSALVAADFGLTGATGEPTRDEMIRWMRGEDIQDEDANPATTIRYAMGDPLHSLPASIVYGGTAASPDVVIYTATNDGYLHAIDGATGNELWSFVPKELLPRMARLYFDPDSKYKSYGLDGNIVPVVFDEDRNGIIDGANDFVRIIFGMRRGGDRYYALDVTNKNQPQMLWISSPAELGQSWSTPVVARVDAPGVNSNKAVVVLGGGYDPAHDTNTHPAVDDAQGAAIIMLDLESGAELWRASRNGGSNDLNLASMKRSIPGGIRVIDISGDGFADRMYAADLGGQILRFDIHNGTTGSGFVTGGVIAQLGAEGLSGTPSLPDTRRFYTSPDVSLFNSNELDARFLAISLGSGYRAHPLDNINSDRFFSVRDPDVFRQLTQNEYDAYTTITEADLVEVSGAVRTQLSITDKGWQFTLPYNQKVLSDSVTFNDSVFFVAFSPEINVANSCAAGAGTNFLYQVSVINGDPVVNNLDILAAADADGARENTLQQGGIAPSPTILFPSANLSTCTGAACSPPPIGCVGVECFNPGFDNNPVRTLWTQDGIQ